MAKCLASHLSVACWAGRTRISCSMKLVSQRDGEDLDPNWVTYKKDAPTGGRPSSGPTGNDIGALDTGAAFWPDALGASGHCQELSAICFTFLVSI